MTEIVSPPGPYHQVAQLTVVLLLFQAAFMLGQLFNDAPYSGSMTGMLVATVALAVVNRRLLADSQGRHASGYILAWRYGALLFIAVASALVALRTYAPQAVPNGTPTVIAMLLSAVIALKGALLGKLKPGGVLGLRLRWTCQSRLAWEKAHRLMGRILFLGGLVGLLAAPFVSFVVIFAGIGSVILIGVTSGAFEGWHVWRNDPERNIAR
jgi:immunity protein, SdpI family